MINNSSNYIHLPQETTSASNKSESPEKNKKTSIANDENSKEKPLPNVEKESTHTHEIGHSLSRKKFEKLLERRSISHTMEFFSNPRCDENFNNKNKVITQSFFSKTILSDPDTFGKEASELTKTLSSLIKDNANDTFLTESISTDVSKEGQFGRLPNNMDEIVEILNTDTKDPINFAQKMTALKSFGDYLTKCVTNKEDEPTFLSNDDKKQLKSLLKKYRPDALFAERGRSGVISKTHREDIGILDKKNLTIYKTNPPF